LRSGTLEALTNRPENAREGIILGADLAHTLAVRVGDMVTLMTPHAVMTPSGAFPMTKQFQVVGIVRFGFYETDTAAAFMTDGRGRACAGPQRSHLHPA
jgi:ABC-type lipoprotein release transport system permease subunit